MHRSSSAAVVVEGAVLTRTDLWALGLLLILIVDSLSIRWIDGPDTKSLICVGLLWLVLTTAFELMFDHFVFRRS